MESDELFAHGVANPSATGSYGTRSRSGQSSKKPNKGRSKEPQTTTLIDVGFPIPVSLPVPIPLHTRVTVEFSTGVHPTILPVRGTFHRDTRRPKHSPRRRRLLLGFLRTPSVVAVDRLHGIALPGWVRRVDWDVGARDAAFQSPRLRRCTRRGNISRV